MDGVSEAGRLDSGFSEDQVDRPAAAHMRPGTPKMFMNCRVRVASFFESIGQNRHSPKAFFVVDRLGELSDRAGKVPWLDGDGTKSKRTANVTNYIDLFAP